MEQHPNWSASLPPLQSVFPAGTCCDLSKDPRSYPPGPSSPGSRCTSVLPTAGPCPSATTLPWLQSCRPPGLELLICFLDCEPLKGRRPETGLSPPRCSVSGGSPFVPMSILCVHKPDASSADRDDTRTACQPVTLGARRGVLSVIDMANGIVSHRNRTRPLGPTRTTPTRGAPAAAGVRGACASNADSAEGMSPSRDSVSPSVRAGHACLTGLL